MLSKKIEKIFRVLRCQLATKTLSRCTCVPVFLCSHSVFLQTVFTAYQSQPPLLKTFPCMFLFLDILKMSKNENPRPTFYKVFKNCLKRVYILLVEYYKKGINGSNDISSIFI